MDNTNSSNTKYTHRFLSRIVIEAKTPFAVGSGDEYILTDSLVATDANGLPYIPATSIAGVLRSMMKSRVGLPDSPMDINKIDSLFGDQAKNTGSEIIFSEAKILNSTGKAIDGMDIISIYQDELLKYYQRLPIRQHVRINEKGTAVDKALFNEQVVYAGTRFCFEVEMVSDGENFNEFKSFLGSLFDVSFRIGGGSRHGFGEMEVVSVQYVDFDLANSDHLNKYIKKSSALNTDFWKDYPNKRDELREQTIQSPNFSSLKLELKPESFFLFGSGFGDDEVDMTPVKAKMVEWEDGKNEMHGKMKENLVLIPASSVKGAIAHRVAFHWNRLKGVFSNDLDDKEIATVVGKHNKAVRLLFGKEGDGPESAITRGNVIFSDIIKGKMQEKLFNHVSLDRFTGGAIEGALFSEKAAWGHDAYYKTVIVIDESGLENACKNEWGEENLKDRVAEVKSVFMAAIDDLCKGRLLLGGGVNRGHGIFTGKYE